MKSSIVSRTNTLVCGGVLWALSSCLSAQTNQSAAEAHVVETRDAALHVPGTDGRTVKAICAAIPLHTTAGHPTFAHVIAFFDSSTGAFWWKEYWRGDNAEVSPAVIDHFLKSNAIRTDGKRLVVFSTTDMPAALVIRQSVREVEKVEDAWPIVRKELAQRPLRLRDDDDPGAGVRVISLHKLVQDDFFVPKAYEYSAMRPLHPPDIKSVDYHDSRWAVVLTGANNLIATIVLDERYRPVRVALASANP